MTAPARKSTKSAAVTPENKEEVVSSEPTVTDSDTVTDTDTSTEVETPVNRIPEVLSGNPILADFAQRYLDILDEIANYNKEVLAEKDSEWNSTTVLAKARELGSPEDANAEKNETIATALNEWQDLVAKMNVARRNVINVTAKEIGITLSATSERDPEVEAPLKVKRNLAVEIGKQLSMLGAMTTDKNATAVIEEFLGKNGLPAIGRDQVRTFGNEGDSKSTPKYRVNVVITNKDGEKLVEEAGFTKASLSVAKHYPRGEGIKADKLRQAWEAAGNDGVKVVSPVEFEDNELTFTITKK